MITLTKLTSTKRSNKHFSTKDGNTHTSRGAKITKGSACQLEVADLKEFNNVLKSLTNRQCITLGVFPETQCNLVMTADEKPSEGKYGRNKANIKYPNSDRLCLLDIDEVREGLEFRTARDVYDHLTDLDMTFEMLELLIVPSSSCGVRFNGELIKGYSWHVYMVVDGAVSESHLKDWVVGLSFQNGDGRVKFTESGTYSAVSLFDEAVFSPERVIYAAKSTHDENHTVDDLDEFYKPGVKVGYAEIEDIEYDDIKDNLIDQEWVEKSLTG